MLAGQVTVGAWLSLTVTVKVQSAELFPLASVAWQVTVVVPFGKVEPLGGVQVVVERSEERRVGEVCRCGGESQLPGAVVVVMLAGQVTVGAWLSLTVTVRVQSAELFPLTSVAWQVTVVVPLRYPYPPLFRSVVVEPWQLSLAVVV